MTAGCPYLTEELRAGDQLSCAARSGLVCLGHQRRADRCCWSPGSGVVPLRAILRHRQRAGSDVPARLLYSSRTLADVIYHSELDQYRDGVEVSYTLTRSQPPGSPVLRPGGRRAACQDRLAGQRASACVVLGPSQFVEAVAGNLVALGYPAGRVKTDGLEVPNGRIYGNSIAAC